MVTHIFNAQRGLGHREPGVAGQALADPRLTIGLIADLHHVAAEICKVVMQAARGRVALVTDAVASAGMPPGSYELGGQQIRIAPGEGLARRSDGTIAGSSLSLDAAVRNLVGIGVPLAEVLDAATRVPADVLGPHRPRPASPSAPRPTWCGGATTCARCGSGSTARWRTTPLSRLTYSPG